MTQVLPHVRTKRQLTEGQLALIVSLIMSPVGFGGGWLVAAALDQQQQSRSAGDAPAIVVTETVSRPPTTSMAPTTTAARDSRPRRTVSRSPEESRTPAPAPPTTAPPTTETTSVPSSRTESPTTTSPTLPGLEVELPDGEDGVRETGDERVDE